jgi:hypothetical protein
MRINFYAGPGAGKSVIAAKVFVDLKIKNYNIELCREYIKEWAYQNKVPKSFDQYYVFGKQLHAEDVLLSNGVEHIVTDSPLLMQLVYMQGNFDIAPMVSVVKEFDKKYPALNIFLSREGIPYQQNGRWQNLEEAIEVDYKILNLFKHQNIDYQVVKSIDFDALISVIEKSL